MKKTEKIVLVGYLLLGLFIGVRAMFFYQKNVTSSVFFRGICLFLAIAIAGYVGNKFRQHIIMLIIFAIIAVLSVKLLAWSVVWLTCVLQAILGAIVIIFQAIIHIIKMIIF